MKLFNSLQSDEAKIKARTMNAAKRKKNNLNIGANVLVYGKTTVFVVCSLISALINLIFISNLTKSPYNIGGLISIPAAVFLGGLSIALDLSKVLHVIQVTTLKELYRKLSDYSWADKIKKVVSKWTAVYLLYVALSVVTSISLSTISIGEGITRNANALKTIDTLMAEGEKYANIGSKTDDIKLNSIVDNATDTSERDANLWVQQQVTSVWPIVAEWQEEYTDFLNEDLDPDDKTVLEEEYKGSKTYYDYWTKRDREVNNALSSSLYSYSPLRESSIRTITLAKFKANVRANFLESTKTSKNDAALDQLQEVKDSAMAEALGWIETLNASELRSPETGELVVFDTDSNKSPKVLINSAMGRLSALRTKIENDSGDIGPSSKIFMQMGSFIDGLFHKDAGDLKEVVNAKAARTSFGTTEILMMIMLLFLSLLCELAINQFSPKVRISRKMLYQFSEYFPRKFDIDKFMKEVDEELIKFDMLDVNRATELNVIKDDIDLKSKKRRSKTKKTEETFPVEELEISKETPQQEAPTTHTIVQEVGEKPQEEVVNIDNSYSNKVDDLINEIEKELQ